MGTPCKYCGSESYRCLEEYQYDFCVEADRLLDEALDFELRDYPDDDQPQAPAKGWTFVKDQIFPPPPEDMINHPEHYAKYVIEPIDFIMSNRLPYAEGNVVKYVCRHESKNGLEDIQKAIKYLKFIAKQDYGAEL